MYPFVLEVAIMKGTWIEQLLEKVSFVCKDTFSLTASSPAVYEERPNFAAMSILMALLMNYMYIKLLTGDPGSF